MTNTFFEVSGDDIYALNDSALRELVGQLCEAELRRANEDTSGVLWGGDQDAPDGGFDVVVSTTAIEALPNFMKRGRVGFQVKKPNMQPAKISTEMAPKGQLRSEIQSLIDAGGAYVIVSSGASTTAPFLEKRLSAMRDAVSAYDIPKKLHVDFLDRGRLATWVRGHPSLVLWVKYKIGAPYKGWRSYEDWAWVPKGGQNKFLLDDEVRLLSDTKLAPKEMTSIDGIAQLRADLSVPGKAVRLTGLSGVGKTRLVQALFDDEVGENALNPFQAFYADVNDSPSPDAQTLIDQLVAQGVRAIVVIDNCQPELHRQIARSCSRVGSRVSLISVEYDVREDLPPETSVYRLEASSDGLISELVHLHHPHVSKVDARKIAEFSGGNARIADALASTIQKGETVSGFEDEELFKRLFLQRNDPNDDLLSAAEVLSLVYSFDGEATEEASELAVLGSIIDREPRKLFRDAATLANRHLLQSRSKWRAVLPHAVANRLATNALKKNPKDIIEKAFLPPCSDRLYKSFTRRLNFLHDSPIAAEMVSGWLEPNGWIGAHVGSFSPLGMSLFENIAPVCIEATLGSIERASNGENGKTFTSRANTYHKNFVRLLRAIAYDPEYFERCVALLIRFALSESPDEQTDSIRKSLGEMFRITLSGTRAAPEQRRQVVADLCDSGDEGRRMLGLSLLNEALESVHFSSSQKFDFGARSRDFGYRPTTQEDVKSWYKGVLELSERFANPDHTLSGEMRKVIASRFRPLWTRVRMYDALEDIALRLNEGQPWNEGWVAVRSVRYFDFKKGSEVDTKVLARLNALEEALKPKNLIDRARIYATAQGGYDLDIIEEDDVEDGIRTRNERLEVITRKIGEELALDDQVLSEILPELLSTNGHRVWLLGEGLAVRAENPAEMWETLFKAAKAIDCANRDVSIMGGFFRRLRETDAQLMNAILDELVTNEVLAYNFPFFQIAAGIDDSGFERLKASLDHGDVEVWRYERLASGRAHESLTDEQLVELLGEILQKPEGAAVVIEILTMRLSVDPNESQAKHKKVLLEFGRYFLSSNLFGNASLGDDRHDYQLSSIAKTVLNGKVSMGAAMALCDQLKEADAKGISYLFQFPKLLAVIAEAQPDAFLERFLTPNGDEPYPHYRSFSHWFDDGETPLNTITDNIILAWCARDPSTRYSIIATEATLIKRIEDQGVKLEWKPLFFELLKDAPDTADVLARVAEGLVPTSWEGSLHIHLEQRASLFEALREHADPQLKEWACDRFNWIIDLSRKERDLEEGQRKKRDESFE